MDKTSVESSIIPAILVSDDDDGHAELIITNLRRAGITNKIIRSVDGQETLDRIFGAGEFGEHGPLKSFIVLLDINMSKLSGSEVLQKLRSNPSTIAVPVIMLTTTDDPREIKNCYESGCNLYIVKSVVYEDFVETVARIGRMLQVMAYPN